MLHLLRRNREDVQDFNHDLHDNVSHRVSWWHFRVSLKPFKEVLDTLEEVGKGFLTRFDILGSLTNVAVKNASTQIQDSHQEEDSDTSRDYTRGREYLGKQLRADCMQSRPVELTSPTPPPRVAENA
jgi:hypothetical protein